MSRPAFLLAVCAACNAPAPPPPTGGTNLDPSACGRGLAVVTSDYQSSNVVLTDTEGAVVSPSFISSGSMSAALSAPLSGDVVAPGPRLEGDDVVVIDRFPASVITWIDVTSGDVRAQLDVSTGFAANPRDYLKLHDRLAYVTRFETNPDPGSVPHDAGGDVLMIDPTAVEIVGRIDLAPAMSDAPEFLPRASRMARFDGAVYALLLAYNVDFTDAAASRLVRIEDDVISDVVVLTDLYGCEGLAASEDALAVTCSGQLAGGDTTSPLGSGIAVLQRGSTEPVVTPAASLLGRPLGFAAAFTRTGLLVNVLGAFATDTPDVVLHVTADGFQEVLRSENPFELGDIRCTGHGGCGACFVTDGDAGALHRLAAEDGARDTTLVLDDGIGLPPRVLGRF